jgi:chromosome segregation ATPase
MPLYDLQILISALTNAQAQLHDVQKAFRDTVEQLEVASLSCADAKRQATKAQEESCRQKDQLRDVNTQLKALQADNTGLQAELKEKTGRWAMEKQRMEDDLSRLLQSHSTNPNSEVSKWRSIAEASNIEKARAEAVLQSHRKTEAEATKEVESLRERLATSLANYAALVKEKNELETILDQVKVDLQRTRRKVDALESRGRYPDRTLSLGNKNAGAKTHPTTQFNDASVHVFSTP